MKLIVLTLFLLLAGCSTLKSPLLENEKYIFVTTNEEAIFQAAYDALLAGNKESPIAEMSGPIRGFFLTRRSGPDYWTSMIRVFPAKGITAEGEIITGYYPEVSGEGSMILRGPPMDERIYEAALIEFSSISKKQLVTRIERGKYILETDSSRLNSKASLRDGGSIKIEGLPTNKAAGGVEDRLKRIQSLREKGVISEDEYQKSRSEIIKDL